MMCEVLLLPVIISVSPCDLRVLIGSCSQLIVIAKNSKWKIFHLGNLLDTYLNTNAQSERSNKYYV